MKINTDAKPYDDINVTPMLDLCFVLLVIFIIMTTAGVQGIKVNLAQTPDFPVVVKGDGAVQYAKVVEVLDLLRRLDITKFGLVTGKAQGRVGG